MNTRIQSEHKVNFTASLSNGETIYEGKGDYKEVAGQPSPFQQLQSYLIENKLTITTLGLYTSDGRSFFLPTTSGRHNIGKLQEEFKPYDYNLFRYMDASMNMNGEIESIDRHFTVIEALFEKYKLQLWVNELDTRSARVHLVPSGEGHVK